MARMHSARLYQGNTLDAFRPQRTEIEIVGRDAPVRTGSKTLRFGARGRRPLAPP